MDGKFIESLKECEKSLLFRKKLNKIYDEIIQDKFNPLTILLDLFKLLFVSDAFIINSNFSNSSHLANEFINFFSKSIINYYSFITKSSVLTTFGT